MRHVTVLELHVYRMRGRWLMRLERSRTQKPATLIIETDHQPLVTILKKPIHTAPARLQRMLLQLQAYDITLIYKKGKHMYLADTLSRSPDTSAPQASVFSTARLEELRAHTAQDQVLQTLSTVIQHGWPDKERQLPLSIRPFFHYRDELAVEDGIVVKSHRTVIPHSLQKEYINIMHRGHPGLESTRCRARMTVFWPTMNRDITEKLLSCSVCNSTRAHQQKEPLQPHPVPVLPWSTVATDVFEWHGQQYMVLVDSYSGWFEIDLLNKTSSAAVITKLKRHFSVHGSPHTLITDNARYYTSQHFKELPAAQSIHNQTG